MESLKDQFENLKEKYREQRQGKTKYRTGKLATDISNNRSILDFISSKEETKEDEESSNLSALLSETDEGLQEALIGLQNSEIKRVMQTELEEVKEEEDDISLLSEIASLVSPPRSVEERVSTEEPIHLLKGDRIIRVGSPRKPHISDVQHLV